MPQQAYRLRIRNAADTANALVITSVRGGTNPYIASVPSGDGQEVDLLTGAVRTGAYVCEVVDVVTGSTPEGTLRIVTSQLYDGVEEYLLLEDGDKILLESGDPIELELNNAEYGRPHLLSRKAYIEVSTDGGATFPTVWQAGFLSSVVQIDAMRYAFTVSNTRRVEQTQRVFSWTDPDEQTEFPKRGCIIGGPVIGGFGATTAGNPIAIDTGGWRFRFLGSVSSLFSLDQNYKAGCYLSLSFRSGSVPPQFTTVLEFTQPEWNQINASLQPFLQWNPGVSAFDATFSSNIWNGLKNRTHVAAYPNVMAIVTTQAGVEYRGTVVGFFTPSEPSTYYVPSLQGYTEGGDRLFIKLDKEYTDALGNPLVPFPTTNPFSQDSMMRVRFVSREVTPQSPLYFDLHPVDIVTKLYTVANIGYKSDAVAPYDVGSAQWMKEQLGPDIRLAARITEPQTMATFLEKAIFGPFGFATRTNGDGLQEFFVTRQLGGTINYTITDADIQGDAPPAIWSLDEGTAVTGFQIQQKQYTQWVQPTDTTQIGPPDNIVETAQPIQILNGDTTTFSTRIVEYDIPGMVHNEATFTPSIGLLAGAIAEEGFDRFGRGAPSSEIPVLGTSAAAAAQVGDLVYINASYYPNKNYRIGESSVGARVAQVVRRDERPEGPVFKLVDAGVGNQPTQTPTISIAASTVTPRSIAQFTITNAATLNNTAEIAVAVEWATGSSTPSAGGLTYARYLPGQIPTIPVTLPSVIPGSTVWVRARSEQEGLFPSAWTAWTSVTLTAWVTPTSLTNTTVSSNNAFFTWNLNGNTTDGIDVFLVPDATVAPADWTIHRVMFLQAGSDRASVSSLQASTNYVLGIAFVDTVTNTRGAVSSITFATTTAVPAQTATRPAGISIRPGSDTTYGGIWVTGIQVIIYPSNEDYTYIERAPNTVVGGVDTPGTFTLIRKLPGSETFFLDNLPVNGVKYWYRAYHVSINKVDSAVTPAVMGTAEGVWSKAYSTPPQTPIVTVETSEAGGTATVLVTVEDDQNRLQQVRFREQTNNGGWSAWVVDSSVPYSYSATIPATGFVEIEYEVTGFSADGVSRVLAAGVESFDVDTIANIVSATGTFNLAGALTLAVQADTDTNSFKYAVATTNWVSDAAAYSAAQAGTLVNARNGTISLAGPYTVGDTVYVAIAAYSGASGSGTVSGPYRYAYTNGSRDTVPLMGRARVTATTATDMTVRYAVACAVAPSPNTASIAYSTVGLGAVTPASPQTVTPELNTVVTEAASSYADFTVPRPSPGSASGRITFTVTATGRVADTDSVDVPAQDLVAPSLKIVTTPSSSSYSLVITWDGTIVYNLDGVSQSVSGWTSPRTETINRNGYLGATKVAAFAVTKNSITVSESINVPPKDTSGATLTIGTQTADDTTDDYTFSWTATGFPTGTQYDLLYTTTTTAGVVERGYDDNATSPVTVASGYDIGASPTYSMTVNAVKDGVLILSKSRTGTFLT